MNRPKTYRVALAAQVLGCLTFWRNLPSALSDVGVAIVAMVSALVVFMAAIVDVVLVLLAPLMVVVTPVTAWLALRRQRRRAAEVSGG